VGTLVGIPELNTAFLLDPYVGGSTESTASDPTPIATGNQVSCEFNLISRFHMLMSDRDDKWTQDLMQKILPGKDCTKISWTELYEGLLTYFANDEDPSQRTLGDLTRGSDGTFDNDSLIKILTTSTEDCAGIPKSNITDSSFLQLRHPQSPPRH
jgi:hypothetical protein